MFMVEGVDNFEVGGQTFALEIAAVSEVEKPTNEAKQNSKAMGSDPANSAPGVNG